jgi:hypothetical protein
MSRVAVNSIKAIPDSLAQASQNLDIIDPTVNTLDFIRYRNIVQNFVNTPHVYTGVNNRGSAVIINELTTSITTQRDNCKIMYNLFMSVETSHDQMFFLERVIGAGVVELGSGNPDGARAYGFSSGHYDNNIASTMSQIYHKFLDQPNVPAGTTITYRVRFYSGVVHNLWLNRTTSDTNNNSHERGSSTVILEEVRV